MQKLLSLLLVSSLLGVSTYANQKEPSIQVYGAGEKIDDKSYKGAGLKYLTPELEATIEYGNDYKKASAIYKYDILQEVYIKGGLGFLQRELNLTSGEKDVDQTSGGVAFGYGDNKNYNFEAGHIISKLSGVNSNADGYSRVSYIEALGKYDFGEFGTSDITGVYKNTHVYSTNYSDYSLEAGYYPTQFTNDFRVSAKYDSVEHDDDNYVAKMGIEYIFATKEFKPYITLTKYSSKRVSFALTYENNIANKSLSMRDEFENAVGTSDIVAQKVAENVFNSKANPQATQNSSGSSVSNPTITVDSDHTINDNGGAIPTNFGGITLTNVVAGAVYSIVADPTGGKLTIDPATGVMTWSGDINPTQVYTITIKVTNPDSGNDTDSFTLTVNDNA